MDKKKQRSLRNEIIKANRSSETVNMYLYCMHTFQVWNLRNMYRGPKTLTGHDGIILAVCTYG